MKHILTTMVAAMTIVSCANNSGTNPFLTEWDTPYGIPPFEQIGIDDYMPAINAGIEQQNAAIATITSNAEEPTFDNTIAPLELSSGILDKVSGVLYNISETDRTDELDSIVELAIPVMTEHSDNISFNQALFQRIAKLYEGDQSSLTREQQMVLKKYYEQFQRSGSGLPQDKQDQLRKINTEMASKQQKIGNNILAESNAFKAKFGISVSEFPNAMTSTEDRNKRKEMYTMYTMRGHNGNENDNRQLILDVVRLRIEKAKILGYKNPAQYYLEDKMAHDPETVDAFLGGIMKSAVKRAKEEVRDMQQLMDKEIAEGKLPAGSRIEPWDWWYYAEKVRKQQFDLDESQVKPYFKLENVVKGVFLAAN